MTGKCVKCGKDVKLETDGSCKCCHKEICWECWVAAGHECPNCGDFDGKRDTANSDLSINTHKPNMNALVGHSWVVSFSGGKDSTAMLHLLLEQGVPVSHVVYFETEWDFPQMRAHLDLVTAKTGLRIIRVRYYRYFEEMLALWGWPKSAGGWCTASKHRTCLKYIGHIKGDKTEYIGFSADEVKRTQTKWMKERRCPVRLSAIGNGQAPAAAALAWRVLNDHE